MFRRRNSIFNCPLAIPAAWFVVAFTTPFVFAHPEPALEIDRLTQQLQKEPKRIDLLLLRAHCNAEVGRAADAVSDLDAAQRIDPQSRLVRLQRGLVLAQLNRTEEAEGELSRYIKDGGEDPRAWIERARMRARLNRLKEAVSDYDKALATSDDLDAYIERGAIQEKLGRLEDAAAGYQQGLARMPRSVVLQIPFVRVETARKRYPAAIRLIDEAMATAPVKTDWYLRRADVHAAAGNKSAAQADREAALREAERMVAAKQTALNLLFRARAFAALDRWTDARKDLLIVRKMSPQLEEGRLLLATVEHRLNDKPETGTAAGKGSP